MLARRFTIVCLLIAIFGMSLSILVAEKSRLGNVQTGLLSACDIANPVACVLPFAR